MYACIMYNILFHGDKILLVYKIHRKCKNLQLGEELKRVGAGDRKRPKPIYSYCVYLYISLFCFVTCVYIVFFYNVI